MRRSQLLYPEPLVGGLPTFTLTDEFQQVDTFGTASPMAYRLPRQFEQPGQFLITISSVIGDENNWVRAGVMAQVLAGLPVGDPKKEVVRVYLDERLIELDGAGFPYYLELWPVQWLADYFIEVWGRLLPTAIVIQPTEPVSIGGITITINGVAFSI